MHPIAQARLTPDTPIRDSTNRMSLFIFAMILNFSRGYSASPPADSLPHCVRPVDFANGKFVASYEACLKRQASFCLAHKINKECLNLPVDAGKPYFKITVDDIDPKKSCKVQKDGSYACIQDPVRFMAPITQTNSPKVEPAGTPGATPSGSGPKAIDVPVEENGSGGETTAPQGAPVLPPPPKK